MGQKYIEIGDRLIGFIRAQKIFFVATAAADDGRINVSPKGMDSLRVVNSQRVLWLNVTGSGNETAAHIQDSPRMTLMFCSFEQKPLILRLYGRARAVHRNDPDWDSLFTLFRPLPGARQIFDVSVELVQTSCGMAVPLFDFVEERDQLNAWADKKGQEGLKKYWREKNHLSLDGIDTDIVAKNT